MLAASVEWGKSFFFFFFFCLVGEGGVFVLVSSIFDLSVHFLFFLVFFLPFSG